MSVRERCRGRANFLHVRRNRSASCPELRAPTAAGRWPSSRSRSGAAGRSSIWHLKPGRNGADGDGLCAGRDAAQQRGPVQRDRRSKPSPLQCLPRGRNLPDVLHTQAADAEGHVWGIVRRPEHMLLAATRPGATTRSSSAIGARRPSGPEFRPRRCPRAVAVLLALSSSTRGGVDPLAQQRIA